MRFDHQFRASGFHSAIMSTFSFDPIAFENVTLTNLKSSGCRNVAVLVDSRMLRQAIIDIGSPAHAGIRYHLAPRALQACFHPKIVIQLGRETGRLLVGSSNLTSAGMISNLEAFTILEKTAENAGLFSAALNYIDRHSHPSDKAMAQALRLAREMTPWLKSAEAVTTVDAENGTRIGFFTDTQSASIGEQFVSELADDTIRRLIVVSPFWDQDLTAVTKLREMLGRPTTFLIPDIHEQDFSPEFIQGMEGIHVCSPSNLSNKDNDNRVLHAKVIFCEGERANYSLTGSMNASKAGLFGRGEFGGNAEAAIFRRFAGISVLDERLMTCLDNPFPPDRYHLRSRATTEMGDVPKVPRDGGLLILDENRLHWIAPPEVTTTVLVQLTDDMQLQVETVELSAQGYCDISEDCARSARYGVIVFSEIEKSAPIPLSILKDLERASLPPVSKRTEELIRHLENRTDIRDVFDLLDEIHFLLPQTADNSQKRYRTREDKAVDETPKEVADASVSTADYLDVELIGKQQEDHHQGLVDRDGTLSALGRALDRQMGAYHQDRLTRLEHDAEDLENDLLSEEEREINNRNSDANASSHDSNNSKGNADPPESKSRRRNPNRAPLDLSTLERRSAEVFIDDLKARCRALGSMLHLEKPGGLTRVHALLFRAVAMTTLKISAFDMPDKDHPLIPYHPNASVNCWTRIVAILLTPHLEMWANEDLLFSELTDDQMKAIAMLFAAGEVMMMGIKNHPVPHAVRGPFERAYFQFLSTLGFLQKADDQLSARLGKRIDSAMGWHDVKRLLEKSI